MPQVLTTNPSFLRFRNYGTSIRNMSTENDSRLFYFCNMK